MSADLDDEKQAILLKFRERVAGLLHCLKNDFHRSDDVLVKFLIVWGYNVDKAEEMYRKAVEWRQANNVNLILERPFCHELDPYYEVLFPGFDKMGHPIFITQASRCNLLGVLHPRAKTETATIITQFLEKATDLCAKISQNGKMVTKGFVIIDCSHFDYKLLANTKALTTGLSLLKENCQMVFNYYPNFLHKFVVINATQVFQIAWAVVRPLLPSASIGKVRIYGNNKDKWKNYLLEHIDPEVLPSQYGGANTTSLLDCRFEPDKDFIPRRDLVLLPPDDLLECYIEPRKSFSVVITTTPGDHIVWNFKTKTQDIGFKVVLDDGRVVIESCRVDAHKFIQKGRLRCPCEAKYTFTWDNSYSYVSGKRLFYALRVENTG